MAVSARGLFRATGKRSTPVALLCAETGETAVVEHLERDENDFYPTPPEPIRALLAAERDRLADFPLIWEPAAGDGALTREMQRAGFGTVGSDLIDRGCGAILRSFYDFELPLAAAVITNPPFQECNWRDGKGRWIFHALETLRLDYMALLLPWSWPGAAGLAGLWGRIPPSRVYLMRWRIDFTNQGNSPTFSGWFVWDRQHRGETVLRMMDRVDPAQGVLFR
jgi:hypothetical protein